jgi:hypothetical protein
VGWVGILMGCAPQARYVFYALYPKNFAYFGYSDHLTGTPFLFGLGSKDDVKMINKVATAFT